MREGRRTDMERDSGVRRLKYCAGHGIGPRSGHRESWAEQAYITTAVAKLKWENRLDLSQLAEGVEVVMDGYPS